MPILFCFIFVLIGLKDQTQQKRKNLRIILIVLLVLVRGSRYIMDILVGRFDIFDLLSLQICHIDLVILIICLIKPNKGLFNVTFLIGIPMGLAVALFPGRIHPEPGLSRAILFIMSHMMLVVSPVYLTLVEKMKLNMKYLFYIIGLGNIMILISYIVNKILGTNFLYIMYAPEGTIIKGLDNIFGWPGYIMAMDVIAIIVIISVFTINKTIDKLSSLHLRTN